MPQRSLTRYPTPDTRHPVVRRGFTLIETALTTVIIGTGVLAIVSAQQAYLRKNIWAQRTGTAVLLANEVRERMLALPLHDPIYGTTTLGPEAGESPANYNDVDDFAGAVTGGVGAGTVLTPPLDATGVQIPDMTGWSQAIQVESVLPDNISSTFTQPLGSTELYRVSVTITWMGPGMNEAMTLTQLVWVMGPD